jgi:4-amino-4-deoxy-L-arabinose transferase-like glycosyltransferase
MVALFREVVSDVTEKRDLQTILAIACLLISLCFVLFGVSSFILFDFLALMNLTLAGWLLHIGWLQRGQQQKPKVLIITGIALGLSLIGVLQFNSTVASLA